MLETCDGGFIVCDKFDDFVFHGLYEKLDVTFVVGEDLFEGVILAHFLNSLQNFGDSGQGVH